MNPPKLFMTTEAQHHGDGHFLVPTVGDAPSGCGFIALLDAFRASGGTVPGEIIGRLLEDHQAGNASLAKRLYTGQVFGFEWRSSLWIPMFQFDAKDLSIKPGPQQVRAELPSLWPGWMLASWFAAPNARLDVRRPVDLLDSDLYAALLAARSWQSVTQPAQRPLASRMREVPTLDEVRCRTDEPAPNPCSYGQKAFVFDDPLVSTQGLTA
jgi:hypothetical protein